MGHESTHAEAECPRCGYDLSGVITSWKDSCPVEGVCSECGLGMRYGEVLNPRLTVPRWSFEHARRWAGRRLVGTWARSLAPWWFWKRLRMEHPLIMGRLVASVAVLMVACHLTVVAVVVAGAVRWNMQAAATMRWRVRHTWEEIAWMAAWPYGGESARPRWLGSVGMEEWGGVVVLWGALAPLFVLVLPQMLRRCRVRRGHLVRVLAYTMVGPVVIVAVWAAAMGVGAAMWESGGWRTRQQLAGQWIVSQTLAVLVVMLAWMVVCWGAVAKRYLRLPRAWGVAWAVVVMSGMTAGAIVAYWPGSDLVHALGWWLWGR